MFEALESEELSDINIEEFNQTTRAGFAFRTAARVLPLLTRNGNLNYWAEQDQEKCLAAVIASLHTSLAHALNIALPDNADLIIHNAVGHAASLTTLNEISPGLELFYSSSSTLIDLPSVYTHTIEFAQHTQCEANMRTALTTDLHHLQNWQSRIDKDEITPVAEQLLFAPLWNPEEETHPPEDWQDTLSKFEKVMMQYGQDNFYNTYMNWLNDNKHFEIGFILSGISQFLDKYGAEFPPPLDEKTTSSAANTKNDTGKPKKTVQDTTPLGAGIAIAKADVPSEVDQLGRKRIVDTLADMLSSPDQPLPTTIALLGDWGAGKSSVIQQLRMRLSELAKSRIFTKERQRVCAYLHAEFNAWEYEQTDNIRAGLAQEVVNGLVANMSTYQKAMFAIKNAWQQHRWPFVWTVFSFAMVTTSALLTYFVGVPIPETINSTTGSFLGVGAAAVVSFILYNAWRTARTLLEHPLATQLHTYLKLPDYGNHLGLIPVIKKQIEGICAYRLKQEENCRLLVVVDDLDRCNPECITETLDAVRLVMNIPNVAVIIAIDDRVAFQAVAKHYRRLANHQRPAAEIARDYLGKIIQLPINLPEPEALNSFISEALFQLKPEQHAIQLTENIDLTSSTTQTKTAKPTPLKHSVTPPTHSKSPHDNATKHTQTTAQEAEKIVAQVHKAQAIMLDTRDELEWFQNLVHLMAFNNPRLLIRLKNSYRFLKGSLHAKGRGKHDNKAACKRMMHALFWREYLYQLPLNDTPNDRRHAEHILWKALRGEQHTNDEKQTTAYTIANKLVPLLEQPVETAYKELMEQVALVILPSSQSGILLTKSNMP